MASEYLNPLLRRLQERGFQSQTEIPKLGDYCAPHSVTVDNVVFYGDIPDVVPVDWLKDLGSASQQDPTPVEIFVRFNQEEKEKIDSIELRVSDIEKKLDGTVTVAEASRF